MLNNTGLDTNSRMYQLLFNNSLNGIAYCKMEYDAQGEPIDFTYLAVNKAFEELTKLKHVIGKKVSEVIPGIKNDTPELFNVYGRVSKGGQPELFEIYLEYFKMWFLVSVYCPEKGYFIAVFNVSSLKLEDEIKRLKEEVKDLKKK